MAINISLNKTILNILSIVYIMRRRICISILLVLAPLSVCSLVYPSSQRLQSIQKVRHSSLSPSSYYSTPRHRQHTTISNNNNNNNNIYRQRHRHRSVSYLTTKEDSSDDSIVSMSSYDTLFILYLSHIPYYRNQSFNYQLPS